jgi:sporulation protein YunB
MRLKYYKKTLRQIRLNRRFVFFLLTILFVIILFTYMYKKVVPIIMTLSESISKSLALEVTNKSVTEVLKDIKYENLIDIKLDGNGKVIAVNSNVMELNRLSTEISSKVLERLSTIENRYIKIPLASILGMSIFSGYGPTIKLNIIPSGSVTAKFNSEFEEAGINQTRHRIFININTKVKLIAPFYTATQEYTNDVTVAETVLVGNTPSSYYNINGIENLDKKDTLNMLEK